MAVVVLAAIGSEARLLTVAAAARLASDALACSLCLLSSFGLGRASTSKAFGGKRPILVRRRPPRKKRRRRKYQDFASSSSSTFFDLVKSCSSSRWWWFCFLCAVKTRNDPALNRPNFANKEERKKVASFRF